MLSLNMFLVLMFFQSCLTLWSPHLGNKELICMLLVHFIIIIIIWYYIRYFLSFLLLVP